ncbi:hypothetical protein [Pseudomonas amygdali]|uniref:hypothetical protein n=1 Tax=Pseudomonas amygdali TaxID=47877 RepID=UPI001071DE61|nr:hypothetical protein [Pseudomonas amygdali]
MNKFTGLVFLYDCSEVLVSHLYDGTFIKQIYTPGDKTLTMEFREFYMHDIWSCDAGVRQAGRVHAQQALPQ